MPHNYYHLYANRERDGVFVNIDDVANGKKCGCICSKCKEPIIAKNGGKIKIHHFAHNSGSNCTGETLAHLEAKAIIKKEKYLWLPASEEDKKIEFDDVKVEEFIGDSKYRADLICKKGDKSIVVEIVVTHDLDNDKASYLIKKKVNTLNIDLSNVLTKDQYNNLPENFSDMVLKTSDRTWFYNSI